MVEAETLGPGLTAGIAREPKPASGAAPGGVPQTSGGVPAHRSLYRDTPRLTNTAETALPRLRVHGNRGFAETPSSRTKRPSTPPGTAHTPVTVET